MQEKASITNLQEKELVIYPYTNHTSLRSPGLIGLYVALTSGEVLYYTSGQHISFTNIFLLFIAFTFIGIAAYFINPIISRKTIVLTKRELIEQGFIGQLPAGKKIYQLSTIANFHMEIAEKDKKKQGLQKLTPFRNMLFIIIWGSLIDWLYTKNQKLILLGSKGKLLGAINLTGYYEIDITQLISLLKKAIEEKTKMD